MRYFALKTWAKILDALGKPYQEDLSPAENELIVINYSRIIEDLSMTTPKQLEAYLAIRGCRTYKELADEILKKEGKNLSKKEYAKFLGALRARAHRGRVKIVGELRKAFERGTR